MVLRKWAGSRESIECEGGSPRSVGTVRRPLSDRSDPRV